MKKFKKVEKTGIISTKFSLRCKYSIRYTRVQTKFYKVRKNIHFLDCSLNRRQGIPNCNTCVHLCTITIGQVKPIYSKKVFSSSFFWPRARSEAVLVQWFFLFFILRKPKSLILHEKIGKSHSEWESQKVSFGMGKPESLILHEKNEKSHLASEAKKSYLA